MRIIVSGFIGTFCISGITWHYAQYPVGLQLLGHDVYYIEDTCGVYNYHDPAYEWDDPTPVVDYISKSMDFFGLNKRWAYRDENSKKWFGLSEKKIFELCSTADAIISVSNSIYFRDEYMKIPVRVLVDTDPMFTQIPIEIAKASLSKFTHHFSFGANILEQDSKVPPLDFLWRTTRQPVCLKFWENTISANSDLDKKQLLTTIMNLSPKHKLIYENEEYGQKDVELEKIIDLPKELPEVTFEMVMSGSVDAGRLKKKGWHLSNNLSEMNNSIYAYRDYIKNSLAEFSVAKETYVKANTGWFSDRSACYLAAGRPAIVQETQWSKYIPSGKGVLAFSSLETARDAVIEVTKNYKAHSIAAKEIANDYFDSSKVLSNMISQLS